jgi:hypothetical protein
MLSGRGLCDGLITRPETDCGASNECDLETSRMRRPWPSLGLTAANKFPDNYELAIPQDVRDVYREFCLLPDLIKFYIGYLKL